MKYCKKCLSTDLRPQTILPPLTIPNIDDIICTNKSKCLGNSNLPMRKLKSYCLAGIAEYMAGG